MDDAFIGLKKVIKGISIVPAFIMMFFPACVYDHTYVYYIDAYGKTHSRTSNSGIGSIYEFIFGSSNAGYIDIDTINFNFVLFFGFLALLVYFVFSIISMLKSLSDYEQNTWKFDLVRTICCGISTFFLNPIFISLACENFYNNSSYMYDYKHFSICYFPIVFLFIYLLVHFILNLIFLIKSKRTSCC